MRAWPWTTRYSLRPMPLVSVPSSESVTRGSRRMLSSFRRGPSEAKTMSEPSSPTQTQLTCALPSGLLVTRCASASLSRMARASSGISVTRGSYAGRSGTRSAVRGVLAAPLVASAVVGGDVLLELRVGRAERVRAVAARLDHVEQVPGVGRVGRRLDGGQPRIADRRGRQADAPARVEVGVDVQVGLAQRLAPVVQAIAQGGVDAKRDALLQAVVDHRRDEAAVLGHLGLALD